MANQFLDATEYSKAFLILLKNSLVAGRLVSGQFKNEVTDENGLKINIKRPPRFIANDGAALQEQDMVVGSANVAVDNYKNVHIGVTDLQAVQSFNDLMRNETMQSAASELAHTIDGTIIDRMKEFHSSVGTPGTAIGSPQQFNKSHTRLMDQSAPNENLNSIVSFEDGELIRGSLTGTDIGGINRSALQRVNIPIISEVNLYASNNLRSVTSGTRLASGGTVNGASQNVNYRDVKDINTQSLILAGVGANATINRGEILTIAGVFAINPRSREVLPYLQQFVIMEDATADGAGDVTVTISVPIIVPGTSDGTSTVANTAFATVSAAPANGAAVTFYNAPGSIVPVRATFHKRAIALVSARLEMPFTGEASFVTDKETGISIRYWRGSDITTGKHIHRWDTIFGVENVQPLLGTRVNGTP